MSPREEAESCDNWTKYQKLVLNELERLSGCHDKMNNKMDNFQEQIGTKIGEVRIEIAMLKVKSGIWGLMGGLIPVLVLILVNHFTRG